MEAIEPNQNKHLDVHWISPEAVVDRFGGVHHRVTTLPAGRQSAKRTMFRPLDGSPPLFVAYCGCEDRYAGSFPLPPGLDLEDLDGHVTVKLCRGCRPYLGDRDAMRALAMRLNAYVRGVEFTVALHGLIDGEGGDVRPIPILMWTEAGRPVGYTELLVYLGAAAR